MTCWLAGSAGVQHVTLGTSSSLKARHAVLQASNPDNSHLELLGVLPEPMYTQYGKLPLGVYVRLLLALQLLLLALVLFTGHQGVNECSLWLKFCCTARIHA
jgi:hypothetical protein